ncbi:hypothetical protein BK010_06765 [Tenericutes bacterium MO-XQ]|nr:hypothetical protein BK010_06765 [Tenericutes bacterium MO-XQ]
MNYRTKMNLITLLFQLGFLILYSVIFFNDVENSMNLSGNSLLPGRDYRINVAIIFGISQVLYLFMQIIMNKNDKLDERNKKMEATSAGTTIVTMLFISFISLLGLYVINIDEGQIPIYWLWYLAYAYVTLTIIIFTISNLLIPLAGTKYED